MPIWRFGDAGVFSWQTIFSNPLPMGLLHRINGDLEMVNYINDIQIAACSLWSIGKIVMITYNDYKECIEACLRCASICNYCATACTKEEDVNMMATCIRLDMECAAICYAAAQLMSLGSERSRELCRLCAEICEQCANECRKHEMDHCRQCAEACDHCAKLCRAM